MLFALISTLYRWMFVKGERVMITPSMCVGVRVYCSSDTVSTPSRVSRVVGPLATIGADVTGTDEQASVSMGATASAADETRRVMRACMMSPVRYGSGPAPTLKYGWRRLFAWASWRGVSC